ncbi:MAG: Gfo/Idh/MocA family oxidoreductase [Armatimonadetes bacterium]|nr:Gfo/Idh/MocA family oxidoreductase [Armatimonadota bacterium]
MSELKMKMALVGYGMFGSDVVAGTLWDLERNGISPYLDRVCLDDYAPHYAGIRFEMVGIGTRSEVSARRAQDDFERETGHRPAAYFGDAPWEAILSDQPDLDVLVVATPDNLHTVPIRAALKRGVHVVAEKPLCLDAGEAEEIIAMADSAGLVVGVDMHKRYDPDHLMIFTRLAEEMGSPIYARGVLEEPLEVSTQTFKWAEQSDPFTYVGIHWVDLFMHYLKLIPLSLYAVGQKRRLQEVHSINAYDAVQVSVTHTNGLHVFYENNWITPPDFEGPVNQESQMLGTHGKVESDSQYRGLRYWIENKGSRTSNTHFFRRLSRPDGSKVSLGYGKDSLIVCLEKVCRHKALGVAVSEMARTYPDALSQRGPIRVVHAAREVCRKNTAYMEAGKAPVVTASFDRNSITLHDPHAGINERIFERKG